MTELDRLRALVQVDVGRRGLSELFAACAADFAAACQSIADMPQAKLLIVTGFTIPGTEPPQGETDGPPGALHLARALADLGIDVLLASDGTSLTALRSEWPTLDLTAGPLPDVTHLIALERVGPSHHDGRCRSMRGRDVTPFTTPVPEFEAERRPITIGIGDGGNEIGMGKIPLATIAHNIANGAEIACRVATDFLIVAGISNWGAYALAAGVRHLRGVAPLPFDAAAELMLLEKLIAAGPLVDGVTGRNEPSVDGLPFAEYARPLLQCA